MTPSEYGSYSDIIMAIAATASLFISVLAIMKANEAIKYQKIDASINNIEDYIKETEPLDGVF